MVTFRPAKDLAKAASFTLTNMRPYYEQYSVDWDEAQIEKMTQEFVNFDILLQEQPVGVIRLSFDNEECYLRDLQVDQNYQNRGIGSHALAEAERLAKEHCSQTLKLRVFKNSPAVHLYKRQGFGLTSEDERFYYMSRAVSSQASQPDAQKRCSCVLFAALRRQLCPTLRIRMHHDNCQHVLVIFSISYFGDNSWAGSLYGCG